jgi:UDP-glucose 4-epimerase
MTDPIVITGIAGNLGRLIVRSLHTEHSIIGIDQRPFRNKPKDVIHHQIDPRRRKAEDIFRTNSVRALINLGMIHRPQPGRQGLRYREQNTLGTIKLLEYCQRYGVTKVVLMSTAYVYGAQPTNSNFLTEDAPLVGNSDYPQMAALIEWDMYAQSFFWKHPEIETVILRPVHVVGPSVRNAPANYLRLKHPPTLLGFDPMVQLVHEQDLIQAIGLALEPGRRGVFNIVGPGELPLSRVLAELGREPIPVPHPLAEYAIKKLWRFGLSAFPPGELPHLRYQCMVDGARATEVLGYRPRFSLKETIRSVH